MPGAERPTWRAAAHIVAGDSTEEFWALKDVSFEVKRGEVLGIIGRNGAGKSTLLKILSRITEPTEGRVTIKGRVASLLEVGTGFHPELTGRENIYLNGAILGMTRAEIRRKFDEIVAFAEVEKFLDTPVKRYSSGMYVRLAFAVAAHLEPEILIVDEVLAVGDAEFQKKCLGKIADVAGGGRTVIFVSHNMRAIVQLCDRCLLLKDGRLGAALEPKKAVGQYLAEGVSETNGYVDIERSPPINQSGTKEIAFTEFEILNSDGRRCSHLDFGEPATIRITLKSRNKIQDVLIGFSFVTSDGREIQGTEAHDGGIEPVLSSGTHVLSCSVNPMALVPGTYFIRACVFRVGTLYHYIDEVLRFDVTSIPHPYSLVPKRHFVGDIYVPYRWEVSGGQKTTACLWILA